MQTLKESMVNRKYAIWINLNVCLQFRSEKHVVQCPIFFCAATMTCRFAVFHLDK